MIDKKTRRTKPFKYVNNFAGRLGRNSDKALKRLGKGILAGR